LRVFSATPAVHGAWQLSLAGLYGWTSDAIETDDRSQSGTAGLLVGYSPWSFLTIGLSFAGQVASYEPADPEAESLVVGALGDISVSLRTGWALGGGFSLGALIDVWFPAGQGAFGAAGSAISPTALLLLSFTPERVPLGIHLDLGYRYDGSLNTLGDLDDLTPGHLLLSGASSAVHHVQTRLAIEYRLGPVAPLIELNADIPANGAANSAVLMGVGLRAWLGPRDEVQLTLAGEFALSSRPPAPDLTNEVVWSAPPRVGVFLGVAFRLPVFRQEVVAEEPEDEPEDEAETEDEPPEAQFGRIRGQVRCGGEPCGPGVRVLLEESGFSPMVPESEHGMFTTGALAVGSVAVRVTAPGHEPLSQEVAVAADQVVDVRFDLTPSPEADRPGIRGQVMDFQGQPVRATIQIPAMDLELQCDEAGRFAQDLTPGRWDVVIRANGYRTQHSAVEVQPEGVVVMNIELRPR
jgi:hypothetical protein